MDLFNGPLLRPHCFYLRRKAVAEKVFDIIMFLIRFSHPRQV